MKHQNLNLGMCWKLEKNNIVIDNTKSTRKMFKVHSKKLETVAICFFLHISSIKVDLEILTWINHTLICLLLPPQRIVFLKCHNERSLYNTKILQQNNINCQILLPFHFYVSLFHFQFVIAFESALQQKL